MNGSPHKSMMSHHEPVPSNNFDDMPLPTLMNKDVVNIDDMPIPSGKPKTFEEILESELK